MPITKTAPKPQDSALPGENPDHNPRAKIGGNNPPPEEQIAIDFREAMLEKHPSYEQRIEDLKSASDRAVVDSAEAAGKAADLVRSIRAMMGAINDSHRETKQPFLNATRAVDGLKRQLVSPLDEALSTINRKQTEFLRQEEARREKLRKEEEARARAEALKAEEAERARREAEGQGDMEAMEAVEAAPAPAFVKKEPEPIRSADTGASVSGRKVWESQITDYEVAAIQVLDDDKVREAVEKAVARRVKAGVRSMEGVRIYQSLQAVSR
ncbi:hypothetical protein GRI39_02135 [Altererythrobacter indicus]|uniref:Uncharacterized protein n=1 Tax=Altericroceibacterium indicum TaxID=374177 RepID=A0A845A8F7_9SPHN|nr:hypothetical protein [Altericroceibacterium indicum]MXP24846.1 hypothetical protein [Altericroceibacterium indicum]